MWTKTKRAGFVDDLARIRRMARLQKHFRGVRRVEVEMSASEVKHLSSWLKNNSGGVVAASERPNSGARRGAKYL